MLWNRSLVMIDRETESLWSQLLGTAQRGPLKGTELEILPAIMTDWKTWRELHPDTTAVILSRTSKNYRRQFYRNPARFVVGIAASGHARAWPLDQLLKTPVVNDSLDGTPLVVAFDGASRTAFLYNRRLEGHELHLKERGKTMVDRESNSTWDPRTGRATAGPNKGQQLKPIPGIMSFRRAWKIFHPETTFYAAPTD
jgi:hypothetical protein